MTPRLRKSSPVNRHPFGTETTEFHREFAAHTGNLLRRRLLWFIAIWGGLGVLGAIPPFLATISDLLGVAILPEGVASKIWGGDKAALHLIPSMLWVSGYAAAFIINFKRDVARRITLWTSIALITLDGLYGVILRAGDASMPAGLAVFTISHFVAALVFPWTAVQAVIPAAIVLTLSAASRLLFEVDIAEATGEPNYTPHLFAILFSPHIVVPGCLVAWTRHSQRLGQYRLSFVQKRYGSLRQELTYARAIHESLFPDPRSGRSVAFAYKYEPMRQIGGDYLFASVCPTDDGLDERISLVLLDVTGHGIPAALTVNRLHGEIELLFADDPFIQPGQVLARLNRYVHLTLARHSIYVTGLCLRVDPQRNILQFASGGHPPAFLRASDGTLEDLPSTAFVLGACKDADFHHGQIDRPFGPGDSLIAYTDGATEARTEKGQMLRIEGMRRLLAAPGRIEQGRWPERLLEAVTHHREGLPPEDDTLVVEVYRSLRTAASAPQRHDDAEPAAAAEPGGF